METFSRVPAPLRKDKDPCHPLDKPQPQDPFYAVKNLFWINYSIVEDPIIPSPPN
jgi:hypothetical protein